MNLLFLTNLPLEHYGGREVWILEVATRLSERHKVTVIAPQNKTCPIRVNFKKLKFNYLKLPLVKIPPISAFPTLLTGYDVIYTSYPNPFFAFPLLFRKNAIVGLHGFTEFCLEASKTQKLLWLTGLYLLKKSTRKLVLHLVNKDQLSFIHELGISGIEWKYIPNGVDCNRFRPPSEIPSSFKVLWLSQLKPQKRVNFLIKIIKKMPDVKFHIVGSGILESLVKNVSKKYDNIVYHGFITEEEKSEIYRESSLFLFTSEYESFGLVILEAMRSGLPVISFNVPGPRSLIRETGGGVLVNSVDEAVNAIYRFKKLFEHDKRSYHTMRMSVSEMARPFCWDKVIEELERLFYYVQE